MIRFRDYYAPLPSEVLAPAELKALWEWTRRWGAILTTREPPEGKTFVRFYPDRVPLIELVTRRTYGRLAFARYLIEAGRMGKGDRN